MKIPHDQLSDIALRAVIMEFVSRDGTDSTSVEKRIASVQRQLDQGTAELHFDEESETCHIRVASPEGL